MMPVAAIHDACYIPRCRMCAECCRLKITLGGRRIPLDSWCPGLDPRTKQCMMYETRHGDAETRVRGVECLPIGAAVILREVPTTCAYVLGDPEYVAPQFSVERLKLVPVVVRWFWHLWSQWRRHKVRRFLRRQNP